MNTKINIKKLKTNEEFTKIEQYLEVINNTIEANINPIVLASRKPDCKQDSYPHIRYL